ncbi:hypothetical protein COLO4_28220 [Corchorus olitorius]|uniref:Uncharacterized protein n=1 Tax=Corchorus olitorius TaxID=93759 RepID=A0A1R3HM89_9ROSI|nr:hypothetical protein COLO4_28220 [Corchorus olitorius]
MGLLIYYGPKSQSFCFPHDSSPPLTSARAAEKRHKLRLPPSSLSHREPRIKL